MNVIILIIFAVLLFMLFNNSDQKCEPFYVLSSIQYDECKNKGCKVIDSGAKCSC
jgi:hypothetical protein